MSIVDYHQEPFHTQALQSHRGIQSMKAAIIFVFVSVIATQRLPAESAAPRPDMVLWYDKPAARWEQEALPIGNAYMGAMIFRRRRMRADPVQRGKPVDRRRGGHRRLPGVGRRAACNSATRRRPEPEISSPQRACVAGEPGGGSHLRRQRRRRNGASSTRACSRSSGRRMCSPRRRNR